MAYIKKAVRALNSIKEFLETYGTDTDVVISGSKQHCKVWNKFPICVQDVCVDNLVLIKHADDWALFGGNFDDDKTKVVSKDTFENDWRDLSAIRKNHIEYIARILGNLANVTKA